jgi:hypothetical protein
MRKGTGNTVLGLLALSALSAAAIWTIVGLSRHADKAGTKDPLSGLEKLNFEKQATTTPTPEPN